MKPMERRIGIYLSANQILENPGYLEALRDALGLNLVIVGFSGQLPAEVRAASPFDGMPVSDERLDELLCRHLDGRPCYGERKPGMFANEKACVGPSIAAGGDEAQLHRAISAARTVGLEVWLLSGAWTVDDFGVLMYCPSEQATLEWFKALYRHLVTSYGVDGLDITHARYIMTSHPRGLGLCACERCAHAAASMGYDMPAMIADLRAAGARVAELDARALANVARGGYGALDLWQYLRLRPGVSQWFEFRCRLLERNMRALRDSVRSAAGADFVFGADTYPASLALLAGHDLSRFAEFSDFASPLLSHVDIFPMETMVEWAKWLLTQQPALGEGDALRLAYGLAGYSGLAMPQTIDEFGFGGRRLTPDWRGEADCEWRNNPLRDMLRLDLAKTRLFLNTQLPSYPIIQGGGAPHDWPRELIGGIIDDAAELGHQGFVLQGTSQLLRWPLRA